VAQADGVVANGTGAAVRSDLNNQFAAVFTNHSGSSEPSTKYAYQWWADTTTGQLKLRNSANNAWITIFELDGTMLMEDGTVSAPGLAFASDLNTGFFRSAADKINFATGGVERLEIGSSEVVFNDGSNDVDFRVESNGNTHMLFVDGGNDRVGIGTSAPASLLDVHTTTEGNVARFRASDDVRYLQISSFNAGANGSGYDFDATSGSGALSFSTGGSERLRILSDGNLGLGTSSPDSNLVVKGASGDVEFKLLTHNGVSQSRILFADNTAVDGVITYDHNDRKLLIGAGTSNPTDGDLTIDSSGRCGIGSSSPDHKLHVEGSGSQYIAISSTNSDNTGVLFGDSDHDSGYVLYANSNNSLAFGANAAERMRITNAGALAINNTTGVFSDLSLGKLHVLNDEANKYAAAFHHNGNNANRKGVLIAAGQYSGSGTLIEFADGDGNGIGTITFSGSTTAYNTSSDYRLKENVVDIDGAISRIKQLAPKRFNFIGVERTVDGFLAHEAQTVVPEAVTGEKDGKEMQGIDQSKLVPLLTAALQEAIAKIETLEQRLSDAGIA